MAEQAPSPQSSAHAPSSSAESGELLSPLLRRLSVAELAPALVSGEAPDLRASLVQPGHPTNVSRDANPHQADTTSADATLGPSRSSSTHDYFSPFAVQGHSVQPDRPTHSHEESVQHYALSRQTTRASEASDAGKTDFSRVDSVLARHLAEQRDTIAAASAAHTALMSHDQSPRTAPRLRPQRSLTEYPRYPNQSLAALQSQVHPDIHPAPYSSRPVNPSTGYKFPDKSSKKTRANLSVLLDTSDDRQSRTVGNTPIQTPQLFSPRALRHAPPITPSDGNSPIPSPYLHPVQPQAPRETNKATRDVDTYSGRKTINQYEILYEIGKGTHGKVKLARSLETGENVAIKIVQRYSKKRRLGRAQGEEDKVKREVAILKKALHPNVVSMIEVIDDPDLHKIYLVLEFCEAHDVRWRTPGSSDIVIMENRRLERERTGEPDLEISIESDRVLRAAEKRRQRAAQRKRPPLSRISSESEFWSLEYAGDTDDDDDEPRASSEPVTRPGSVPPEINAATPTAAGDHIELAPDSSAASADPAKEHTPTLPTSSSPAQTWDFQGFQSDLERRMAVLDQSIQQHEDDRGRKASVAESTTSHLTDIMEQEIDEELRYVPLLTMTEARRSFRDALLGLEYLHYQGIVHRDIKPENLLRKADHLVKISDFGVSYLGKPIRDGKESEETSENEAAELEEATELAKTVGTPAFYAPELCSLDFTSDKGNVTGQIDVWALGVTLFCLLYARLPFLAFNEFGMMRRIAEDEVFISRKRLKALDVHATSRPNSQGPLFRASKDHRLPHELVYDDVDDDLFDLLKRLFVKDPRKRITVKEIKHHPWVLRDISHPSAWLDETDPTRFTQGKKIEISKEEVADAVIPLKLIERAKSVAKKVGGVLGLGGGSKSSRTRGQSSASSSGANLHLSNASTSTTSTQSTSARSEDASNSATRLARDREGDHPLSQSVTASPEIETAPVRFEDEHSSQFSSSDQLSEAGVQRHRPTMPNRQESAISTAGSIKTIKQSDVHNTVNSANSHTELGSTSSHSPTASVTHSTSSLGAIFGGAGRSFMRSMRSRDRGSPSARSPSSPRSPSTMSLSDHLHGGASVAVSNTSVAGHVHMSGNSPSSSLSGSPAASKRSSMISPHATTPTAHAESNTARRGSPVIDIPSRHHMSPVDFGGGLSKGSPKYVLNTDEANDEEYHNVQTMLARRRLLEEVHKKERSRPTSALSSQPCPPSPDDTASQPENTTAISHSTSFLELSPSSPTQPRRDFRKPLSASSSEDQFASGMSQASFPSIPSVVSADSSVVPETGSSSSLKGGHSSDETASGRGRNTPSVDVPAPFGPLILTPDEEGYTGDHVFESDDDDDDDDSDEEDFLVMNRTKSRGLSTLPPTSVGSSSRPASATRRPPQTTQKKVTRSGSTNTVRVASSSGTEVTSESELDASRGRPLQQTP